MWHSVSFIALEYLLGCCCCLTLLLFWLKACYINWLQDHRWEIHACHIGVSFTLGWLVVVFVVGDGLEPRVLSWMGIARGRYVHCQDLLDLECHCPVSPVHWITKDPSPLRLDCLHHFLCRYSDPQLTSYLVRCLTSGFKIGFNCASLLQSSHCNHLSSLEWPQIIDHHFSSEVQSDQLVGPLPVSISSLVQSSPMGLVPKSHSDK